MVHIWLIKRRHDNTVGKLPTRKGLGSTLRLIRGRKLYVYLEKKKKKTGRKKERGKLLRKSHWVGVVHIHLILQSATSVPGGGSRGYS